MLLKCNCHFNHENTSCMMWASIETNEQMQLRQGKFKGHFNSENASCIMWVTIETTEQMQLRQPRQEV